MDYLETKVLAQNSQTNMTRNTNNNNDDDDDDDDNNNKDNNIPYKINYP